MTAKHAGDVYLEAYSTAGHKIGIYLNPTTDTISFEAGTVTGAGTLYVDSAAVVNPSNGDVLLFVTADGKWENTPLILGKVSDITATAAEVNTLHSSGVTNADLIKLHAITAAAATLNQVGAAAGTVTFDRSLKVAKVTLAALDTGGGIFAWANPEAGNIVITKVVLDVTTKSSAACTLDVGTTAANATTLSDNLIDGVDVGTAAVITDNVTDAGTNGKSVVKLATGKWVTGSMASGAAAGLVGSAYIYYINA